MLHDCSHREAMKGRNKIQGNFLTFVFPYLQFLLQMEIIIRFTYAMVDEGAYFFVVYLFLCVFKCFNSLFNRDLIASCCLMLC